MYHERPDQLAEGQPGGEEGEALPGSDGGELVQAT
jgi:hypothetical protein